MSLKFNIDRPKISEEEINKRKNFDELVKNFKEQSLKKARSDKSWWKNKSIKYSAVIAGVVVVCTVTYQSIINNKKANEIKSTSSKSIQVKTPKRKSNSIERPLAQIPSNKKIYRINNSTGGQINHNKTKITIPKDCFTDSTGALIEGEVEIHYEEFHNKAEILASGIPMHYDSAGVKSVFESAGMFEINGSKDGRPVKIIPEKTINVELASNQTDDRFNQYYFDKEKYNWTYLKRDDIPFNDKEIVGAKEIAKSKENIKKAIEHIPMQIDSVKTVTNSKIAKLSKPKEPIKPRKSSGRPQFELDVDYGEFPELKAFKNAVFEIGSENKDYDAKYNSITWNNATISEGPNKGVNYILTLSVPKLEKKLIVYPVLKGKDYESAKADFEAKMITYKQLLDQKNKAELALREKMKLEQERLEKLKQKLQAEYAAKQKVELAKMDRSISSGNANGGVVVTRLFQISKFGIYNSDCKMKYENTKEIVPVFVDASNNEKIYGQQVYCYHKAKNVVFTYNVSDNSSQVFYTDDGLQICLIKGNQIYLINESEYKKGIYNSKAEFKASLVSNDLNSLSDLRTAMGI
ncbi:MAG: PspA/IM30 family protein [Bacteroidia bacterium]